MHLPHLTRTRRPASHPHIHPPSPSRPRANATPRAKPADRTQRHPAPATRSQTQKINPTRCPSCPTRRPTRRTRAPRPRTPHLARRYAPRPNGTRRNRNLYRQRQQPDGLWQTIQTAPLRVGHPPLPPPPPLLNLPAMIIETPYHIGTLADRPVRLLLWRTPEEGSAPLGGAIQINDPPADFLPALQAQMLPFPEQAAWAAEFSLRTP